MGRSWGALGVGQVFLAWQSGSKGLFRDTRKKRRVAFVYSASLSLQVFTPAFEYRVLFINRMMEI